MTDSSWTGFRSATCLAACTTFGYRGCFGQTGFSRCEWVASTPYSCKKCSGEPWRSGIYSSWHLLQKGVRTGRLAGYDKGLDLQGFQAKGGKEPQDLLPPASWRFLTRPEPLASWASPQMTSLSLVNLFLSQLCALELPWARAWGL